MEREREREKEGAREIEGGREREGDRDWKSEKEEEKNTLLHFFLTNFYLFFFPLLVPAGSQM